MGKLDWIIEIMKLLIKRIRSILASFEENKNYLCEDMERINFLFEEMKQIINPNLKQRNAMGEKRKNYLLLLF